MTNRTVAARYARALFEANAKGENLRQVEVDLTKIHDVIAGHDTLSRVLTNPVISVLQKRAIVVAILSRLKRILSTVNKLATLLAERDRLGLLPDILQIFRAKLREHFGVVEAKSGKSYGRRHIGIFRKLPSGVPGRALVDHCCFHHRFILKIICTLLR